MGMFKAISSVIVKSCSAAEYAVQAVETTAKGIDQYAQAFEKTGIVTKKNVECWSLEQEIELEDKRKQLQNLQP